MLFGSIFQKRDIRKSKGDLLLDLASGEPLFFRVLVCLLLKSSVGSFTCDDDYTTSFVLLPPLVVDCS